MDPKSSNAWIQAGQSYILPMSHHLVSCARPGQVDDNADEGDHLLVIDIEGKKFQAFHAAQHPVILYIILG